MDLPDVLDLGPARLRAVEDRDWRLDLALSREPDVPRWTYYPVDLSAADARARVARSLALRADGRGGRFVVEHRGAAVGTVGLALRADGPWVYYAFLPAGRGRGLATTAVDVLSAWALTHGADRVQAATMLDNLASERVLARASFVRGELDVEPDGVTVTRWARTRADADDTRTRRATALDTRARPSRSAG